MENKDLGEFDGTMELNIVVSNVTIRQLRKKTFNNMCNLFTMELNIVVCNVTIRQLRNKDFDNMCNLFTMELNKIVHTVIIRKLRNKSFKACPIFSQRRLI